MRKSSAIEAFGSVTEIAKALGVTRQYVYQWPDELEQPLADRVRGAAQRLGKVIPETDPANDIGEVNAQEAA
jgi:hypothetical protein